MRRPLVGICSFFIIGIASAKFISIPFIYLFVAGVVFFLLNILSCRFNFRFKFLIYISFLLFGICVFKNQQNLAPHHIQKYIGYKGRFVVVKGNIDNDPLIKNSSYGRRYSFVFNVDEVKLDKIWRKTYGRILVNSFQNQRFYYGQRLILQGKIYKAPKFEISNKFNYREHLKKNGIFGILSIKKDSTPIIVDENSANLIKKFSFSLRGKLRKQIVNYLPSLEANLLRAILLGERQYIPKFLRKIFVQTGTVHILAISGLHIGIIAFIFLTFLKVIRIPRKIRYLITVLFLVFYVFIAGARTSVIRATIMSIVLLGGFIFEKETDILNSLALACFLILLFNPSQLFDIGFQLSFVSVMSIVIFSPKIENCVYKLFSKKNKISFFLWRSLSVSLAVWLAVLGFIVYNFNIITPITVFANLFIIPFMVIVIALGLCFIVISLILPSVGFIFASSSTASLFLLVKITYLLSRIPGAYFYTPNLALYLIFIYYFMLLCLFNLPSLIDFIRAKFVCE
jgi:competence protein ComEC